MLSELRRKACAPAVRAWFETVPPDQLFVSVLVAGEIRQGIARLARKDRRQAAALDGWLAQLESTFADRVLPITLEIADEWGRMNVPDPLPTVDGLLAATARVHRLTLGTRNVADLVRTGVSLLNPFQA